MIRRPSALVPIIAGFGLMLLLLLAVTAIGFTHIRAIGQQLTAIVAERNLKSELAADMRALHAARHQSLLLAAYLHDPFERDDEIMRFNAKAREFIQLRDRFLALPLDDKELALWNQVRDDVHAVEAVTAQVIDQLEHDHLEPARQLIQHDLTPLHERMMATWQKMVGMQHALNQDAVREAASLRQRALNLTLGLSALVIAVGALVALFVVRLSRRLETDLFEEKELAQVTLHGIADAVVRFDSPHHIVLLNPAAEVMLGRSAGEAGGRPFVESGSLHDRKQARDVTHEMFDQVMRGEVYALPTSSFLRTHQGREIEVEGQCAPIHTPEGEIVGSVLVLRDVGDSRALQDRLAWQANHDDLTGLVNRRVFEEHLQRLLSIRRVSEMPLSILFIDLDYFKLVNDTAGHAAGDALLRQLSQVMRNQLRQTDLMARLGGDEFSAILTACPEEIAMRIAEDLRQAVGAYRLTWNGQTYQVGVSIGLVHVPPEWDRLDTCLSAADSACYRAKELGRNQIAVYRP